MNLGVEAQVAFLSAGLAACGAVAVALWRLAERMARIDERLQRSLQCCDQLAVELNLLDNATREHRDALVRKGVL